MRKTKFICLVLSIVMVLSCVSFASATSFPDTANSKYAEAIETIHSLGLVSGYDTGNFGPNDTLTRAQFATMIIRALDYDFAVGQTTTKFTDVPSTHWASGYISLASNLGLIAGYGDGKFGPEDPITYAQAITIMIRALGYDETYLNTHYANVSWPTTYVIAGAKLGLLDGLTYTDVNATINRGETAQVVYNALDEPIVKYNFFGINTNEADDTILKRANAKSTTGLYAYTSKTTLNLIDKIGQYGETYTNKAGNVIAFVATSQQLTGKFNATTGKFVVGTTAYTVMDTTAAAITNAGIATTTNIKDFAGTGTVTLNCTYSGTTITNVYSIVKWTGVDKQLTKSTIYNAKNFTFAGYTLTNDGTTLDTNSFILNGATSIADLKAGDVVTIYCDGSTVRRIDVSSNVVTGKATKSYAKNGITYYTINDTDYTLASGVSALTLGVEYKCYLNAQGVIYKAEVVTGLSYSDYAIYLGEAEDQFVGRYVAYYTADSLSAAKKTYLTVSTPTSLTTGALFTFSTTNGKMNTPVVASTTDSALWNGYAFKIGSAYYYADDACVVWAKSASGYSLVKVSSLEKNKNLFDGITGYYVINPTTNKVTNIVVNAEYSSAVTGTGYVVFSSTGTKLNAKGVSVPYFNGYIDGKVAELVEVGSALPTSQPAIYKANYSGDDIVSLTTVTQSSITCTAVGATYINWMGLEDDVIIYTYKASTGAYALGGTVEIDDELIVCDYDSNNLYDIVVICE